MAFQHSARKSTGWCLGGLICNVHKLLTALPEDPQIEIVPLDALCTMLVCAQQILNARTLTAVNDNVDDYEITPR